MKLSKSKQQHAEAELLVRELKNELSNEKLTRLLELLKAPIVSKYERWKLVFEFDEFYSIAQECCIKSIEDYDIRHKVFFAFFSRNLFFLVIRYWEKNIRDAGGKGRKMCDNDFYRIGHLMGAEDEKNYDVAMEPEEIKFEAYEDTFVLEYLPSITKVANNLGIKKEKLKKRLKKTGIYEKVKLTNCKNIREYILSERKRLGLKIPPPKKEGEEKQRYNEYQRNYKRRMRAKPCVDV
ncbi:MAG: hypothetical protein FWE23_08965 [Chitinivibrionia bacterium]|nr:hypothetical protein [Chitinivibrionia bacterium]